MKQTRKYNHLKFVDIVPLTGDDASGFQHSVPNLAASRAQHGCDSEIIDSNFRKYNLAKAFWGTICIVWKVSFLVLQKRDTYFVFHGTWFVIHWILAQIILVLGGRYIHTPRGDLKSVAMQQSKWKKKLFCKLVVKNFFKKATLVHFLNKSEHQQTLLSLGLISLPHIISPNGLPMTNLKTRDSDNRKSYGKNTKIILGFIGRLDVWIKGIDRLIELAKYLNENKNFDFEIRIAGPSNKKFEKWLERCEHDIPRQVKFIGALYGQDKYRFISDIDILLLLSRTEGMPMVLLEAIQRQVQIICSNDFEIDLGEVALPDLGIFQCNSYPEELTTYIEKSLEQKSDHNKFSVYFERVTSYLNWEKISLKYIEQVEVISKNAT